MSLEEQEYCQPRMHELYRGVRGHASPEKKNWKLDSGKRHTLHSLNWTQLIHTYVYFVELSVLSLVIHNSRALFLKPFQSQTNCKLFHGKSRLISSQSVLNISVTQNPFNSRRISPRGAQKIVTLPWMRAQKILALPKWAPKKSQPSPPPIVNDHSLTSP